jgi:hypothetical protein
MSASWDDAFDRKCRSCAKDYEARIADLEAGVAQALLDIEEVLDMRECPLPYPGKVGTPCRVEALVDAWADASMALVDLLANPSSQAAQDHARAVLAESGFGVKRDR